MLQSYQKMHGISQNRWQLMFVSFRNCLQHIPWIRINLILRFFFLFWWHDLLVFDTFFLVVNYNYSFSTNIAIFCPRVHYSLENEYCIKVGDDSNIWKGHSRNVIHLRPYSNEHRAWCACLMIDAPRFAQLNSDQMSVQDKKMLHFRMQIVNLDLFFLFLPRYNATWSSVNSWTLIHYYIHSPLSIFEFIFLAFDHHLYLVITRCSFFLPFFLLSQSQHLLLDISQFASN